MSLDHGQINAVTNSLLEAAAPFPSQNKIVGDEWRRLVEGGPQYQVIVPFAKLLQVSDVYSLVFSADKIKSCRYKAMHIEGATISLILELPGQVFKSAPDSELEISIEEINSVAGQTTHLYWLRAPRITNYALLLWAEVVVSGRGGSLSFYPNLEDALYRG